MKTKILCELKRSFLLFLWLLLGQFAASALLTVAGILVLTFGAFGVITLVGRAPLWEWIVGGVLICLFWLAMGRFAPHAVRPEPVGSVAVLTMWAVLTSVIRTTPLLFLPQEFCGGMLEQILRFWVCEFWTAKELGLTIACFVMPVTVGAGLYLGQKRTTEASHDEESK